MKGVLLINQRGGPLGGLQATGYGVQPHGYCFLFLFASSMAVAATLRACPVTRRRSRLDLSLRHFGAYHRFTPSNPKKVDPSYAGKRTGVEISKPTPSANDSNYR